MYTDSFNTRFLDLFAGAGGLSEGFIRAGFTPVAHIEKDEAAVYTLKTRMAYHWLRSTQQLHLYEQYLNQQLTRADLYAHIPADILAGVIHAEISEHTLTSLFDQIDCLLGANSIDIILGGPPCQAYSLVGRSRDSNGMLGDPRNYLYQFYAEFLKRYQPQWFLFENVVGLLSAKNAEKRHYFALMQEAFQACGYSLESQVLNASDYGVPQHRKRVILVGNRARRRNFFAQLQPWKPTIAVHEIFQDLPPLQAGMGTVQPVPLASYNGYYLYDAHIRTGDTVTFHIARPHSKQDREIYRIVVDLWNTTQTRLSYRDLPAYLKTHMNEQSFTDRFKVVAADRAAAHTIVAHIAKDGHHFIHPDIQQNRSITPREAARLQTFPDDYFFEGITPTASRTSAFRQIGNAVPVLLAQRLAETLRNLKDA